jgi:RNA polymerase sigma-70 factor (ECF subfamily)
MEQTLTIEGRETVTSDEGTAAEAIGRLFDLHHARLYRLALRMTWGDDDARDLVQECFLRAIEHRVPEAAEGAERWLVRVLINLGRDRQRRAVVRRSHGVDFHEVPPPAAGDPGMSAAVRDAVRRLPVRQRAVVVLHEIEGRTLTEIAEAMGIAAVTARWHLHAALRRLRKELA